jgi:uroporphyrinogen-III synthase
LPDDAFDTLRGADALTFTSPSAVHALVEALGADEVATLVDLPVAVQGPTTGRAARKAGWTRVVEAEPRTFEGLAETLARALGPASTPTTNPGMQ